MNAEFNEWWNSDKPESENPYREDTPAYWAWAGWQAGAAAEHESCAKLFDEMADEAESEYEPSSVVNYYRAKAAAIRARGNHD